MRTPSKTAGKVTIRTALQAGTLPLRVLWSSDAIGQSAGVMQVLDAILSTDVQVEGKFPRLIASTRATILRGTDGVVEAPTLSAFSTDLLVTSTCAALTHIGATSNDDFQAVKEGCFGIDNGSIDIHAVGHVLGSLLWYAAASPHGCPPSASIPPFALKQMPTAMQASAAIESAKWNATCNSASGEDNTKKPESGAEEKDAKKKKQPAANSSETSSRKAFAFASSWQLLQTLTANAAYSKENETLLLRCWMSCLSLAPPQRFIELSMAARSTMAKWQQQRGETTSSAEGSLALNLHKPSSIAERLTVLAARASSMGAVPFAAGSITSSSTDETPKLCRVFEEGTTDSFMAKAFLAHVESFAESNPAQLPPHAASRHHMKTLQVVRDLLCCDENVDAEGNTRFVLAVVCRSLMVLEEPEAACQCAILYHQWLGRRASSMAVGTEHLLPDAVYLQDATDPTTTNTTPCQKKLPAAPKAPPPPTPSSSIPLQRGTRTLLLHELMLFSSEVSKVPREQRNGPLFSVSVELSLQHFVLEHYLHLRQVYSQAGTKGTVEMKEAPQRFAASLAVANWDAIAKSIAPTKRRKGSLATRETCVTRRAKFNAIVTVLQRAIVAADEDDGPADWRCVCHPVGEALLKMLRRLVRKDTEEHQQRLRKFLAGVGRSKAAVAIGGTSGRRKDELRSHQHELTAREVPHAPIHRIVKSLLQHGELSLAVDITTVMLRGDLLSVDQWPHGTLLEVYQASVATHARLSRTTTGEASDAMTDVRLIKKAYQQRLRLFGASQRQRRHDAPAVLHPSSASPPTVVHPALSTFTNIHSTGEGIGQPPPLPTSCFPTIPLPSSSMNSPPMAKFWRGASLMADGSIVMLHPPRYSSSGGHAVVDDSARVMVDDVSTASRHKTVLMEGTTADF